MASRRSTDLETIVTPADVDVSSPVSVRGAPVDRAARKRWWLAKTATVTTDAIAMALAFALAYQLQIAFAGETTGYAAGRHFAVAAISLPLWILLFAHHDLYRGRQVASRSEEFRRVVHASLAGAVTIMVLGFALKYDLSRGWIATSFMLAVLLVTLERQLVRRRFAALRRRGRFLCPVVIVGGNLEGLLLCRLLMGDTRLGYSVAGFVDNVVDPGTALMEDVRVLGRISDVVTCVKQVKATGVIVASSAIDLETSNQLARELSEAGLYVELSSSLQDISVGRLSVRPLGCHTVMAVEPVRITGWRATAKRGFDIAIAGIGLLVTSPLLVVVAVVIKLDSRGPVLYRQKRVGRGGEAFEFLKLRTMVVDADRRISEVVHRNEASHPLFKIRDDPRITRVGRRLRHLSIDELPQLWNVLRGDMSVVGPRPALADEMNSWSAKLHKRLWVRPGITGMWQIRGRSNSTFAEYERWDLYYLDNWSLWTDVTIVAKTLPAVLSRRGAY